MPRERPMLFSGPMVRTILDGRKTQTRRVIQHRNGIRFIGGRGEEHDPAAWGFYFDGPEHDGYVVLARGLDERHDNGRVSLPCPYGEPGDRLWVRETWCGATDPETAKLRWRPDGSPYAIRYRADGHKDLDGAAASPWRPSIHMPKWASRLTLEVVGARVERLQAITEEDARAEGVDLLDEGYTHKGSFAVLWDGIHRNRPGRRWDDDPWVWVVTFRKMEG